MEWNGTGSDSGSTSSLSSLHGKHGDVEVVQSSRSHTR